jgi:CubicO group peptidase (beta-lactamase class C family)
MNAMLAYAFDEPRPERIRGTRGVVVVYGGRIVAERYAPGFDKDTPLIAWSMTKSITAALAGILVGQGKLDIHAPAPVPEWSAPDDARRAITTDQLLRMSSGLKFEEVYRLGLIDVVVMLYGTGDAAAFAANQPLEAEPEEKWAYSSGTTNIIARILRNQLGGDLRDYAEFPRRELFDPLGMDRTVLEMDEAGTYIGSSFMFSTPRDMARFGLFCLQDGVWNGRRILPEGWMEYVTTPTPKAPKGIYGAQFWLNAGTPGNPEDRDLPNVPPDAYWLSGYQGQRVLVVPSRDAVIVRMGFTPETRDIWDWDYFFSGVLDALPPSET